MVPKIVFHNVTASSLQPATQQCYYYSGLMINRYKNLTVRMQSGPGLSPKGLRSTGLEEEPPGTQDRTSEKQNHRVDWSETPTFPLLRKHPGTSRVYEMPAVLQQRTSVLFVSLQDGTFTAPELLHTLSRLFGLSK